MKLINDYRIIKIILLFSIAILLFNCGTDTKEDKKDISDINPTILLNKINNYNKNLVPFYLEFAILIKTKEQSFQPDGKAKIDTINDRLWIELFEPTLNINLFSCLKIKDDMTIVLYDIENEKHILIKDKIQNIELGKYNKSLDIDVNDLLNVIQGKIPVWENYSKIIKKNDGFYLKKGNKFQYFVFNKNDNVTYIAEVIGKNDVNYMLKYRNYEKQNEKCIKNNLEFPLNAELKHIKNSWKLLFGVQTINFCRKFSDKDFRIDIPPDVEELK